MANKIIDDFLGFSEIVEELSNIEGLVNGRAMDEAIQMSIDRVEMELPVELDIEIQEDGQLEMGGAPPVYYVETSVMPVFHQLKLTLVPVNELQYGDE